ncbi:putative ATP-binding cassette protein subfamily G member 5 [Leptomonas seymouri]|uniref:Putative ATP-binding cassette protein subfamily G member 5 n=1 Tax=Leptomonas seymouri TaxID=5684 RepID=A0A0N1I5R3_LEPSE|nr:putative ATP-binding cassette protein subfamily G member 5 [Leptomonas seymouri]|eukprot:KPI86072.1 putative ATP-binding cassette protein subfamily G member 5 [Leptomonas seymouri]
MMRVPARAGLIVLVLVLVAITVAANPTVGQTAHWAAPKFGSLSAASSSRQPTECFNGGVWDADHCICPLYYTSDNCSQRQCPNSIGGKGPHRILPVNEDNKYCDHCDKHDFRGMSCQLCQSNAACKQYAGANAICDSALSIRGSNKQFQCSLQNDFFLRLMGGKRKITADILLNCSTPDGSAFSKTDSGTCTMAIYRMEPNRSYIDPFFRCVASQCTQRIGEAPPDPGDMNNNTLRQRFFRAAKTSGQVSLVVECALLALLGCFTHILGPRRTKFVTIGMASLITTTVLVYITLMIFSMQPLSAAVPTTIYDCKKTECACAEDPPPIYDPICSKSNEVKAVLEAIKNSIHLTCNQHSSQCELTLSDLDIVFQADCRGSECVDPDLFPNQPSGDDDNGGTGVNVLARQNLGILLCLLLLLVASAVGTHYRYTRGISHERGKEFLVTFQVNTPYDERGSSTTDRLSGRELGHAVVDDSSVSLLGGRRWAAREGPSGTRANAAGSTQLNDDEADESAPLMSGGVGGGSTSPSRQAEYADQLPHRASFATRGSRRADSAVSVRASVYEQASALTPAEYAHIDHLRRLTAAPLELKVSELQYALKTPLFGTADEVTRRNILCRINFTVHSGNVLAIMGPSGAGKTTLLDLLSARAKSGVVSGSISLNGTEISTTGAHAAQYRNIIGYVSQEDTLLPSLTVEQTITYAAQLKLPTALSHNTVRRIVRRIIEALKLQHCAQTLVGGDTTRGISGGEKRRVSIAVELLANPRILYLDEPTSGLDTVSAKRVIEAVVELAKDSPMRLYAPHYFAFRPIVIFSIHQPSQEIYELFDKVLLLSQGVSIYCGPAAAAAATIEQRVTAAFGHTRDVPRKESHNNQAEYVMKVEEMLDDAVRAELQEEDVLDNTATTTSEYRLRSAEGGLTPNPATTVPPCRTPGSPPPRTPSPSVVRNDLYTESRVTGEDILSTAFGFRVYYANTYQQLQLLISRSLTCLVGSFHLVMCHSAVVACLATLMCVLYHQQALDLPGSLNRAGSVSFLLLVTSFVSLSCLEQLILERKLFNVERENGFYTTCPYLISKIVVDIIPLRIIPAMVLASVIYFPMGFRVDAGIHFFYFILIIALFSICITMMILCIGIVSGSFGTAALLSSVFILWNFVFGGALVQAETIPSSLRVFKSLSPFFLAFEPLMVNELNEQHCVFSPTDETGKQSSASIEIMCRQYLANVGLKPERFNADVMQLAVYCLFFVGLAWVLLSTCSKLIR